MYACVFSKNDENLTIDSGHFHNEHEHIKKGEIVDQQIEMERKHE